MIQLEKLKKVEMDARRQNKPWNRIEEVGELIPLTKYFHLENERNDLFKENIELQKKLSDLKKQHDKSVKLIVKNSVNFSLLDKRLDRSKKLKSAKLDYEKEEEKNQVETKVSVKNIYKKRQKNKELAFYHSSGYLSLIFTKAATFSGDKNLFESSVELLKDLARQVQSDDAELVIFDREAKELILETNQK